MIGWLFILNFCLLCPIVWGMRPSLSPACVLRWLQRAKTGRAVKVVSAGRRQKGDDDDRPDGGARSPDDQLEVGAFFHAHPRRLKAHHRTILTGSGGQEEEEEEEEEGETEKRKRRWENVWEGHSP